MHAEENRIGPTIQGLYNRRVGSLLSRTALPRNTLGVPARVPRLAHSRLGLNPCATPWEPHARIIRRLPCTENSRRSLWRRAAPKQ